MYPEIFHLRWLATYGVLVAAGFLTALWLAGRLAKQQGLNSEAITNLGIYCALAALAGAKLMMFVIDFRYYAEHPSEIFALSTIRAGGVFYGGFLAALAVAVWYMRKSKLPGLKTADVFAPAIALGHGIGRIGCFMAGCCWGIECHRPWAVTFTDPVANDLVGVPLNQPLHPTQLYESASEFLIFAILYRLLRKPHAEGTILAAYLALYGAARFIVEFYRHHEQGNLWGTPLDTSQWISLVFIAAAVWYSVKARRLAPQS
ncbi:MAG TPA: prolipoprotein diacylglyceryl transferase [Candidatus Acidoferrales bacterium]|nr:prolipoprotein diacylglyceryl transferase [Candidatus Acidoferrales bacterium]